jgi:hypothetical protein
MPPDSLLDLICEGLAEDYSAKKTRTALGLPGGYPAKEQSLLAMLLHKYQSHWKQHKGLL